MHRREVTLSFFVTLDHVVSHRIFERHPLGTLRKGASSKYLLPNFFHQLFRIRSISLGDVVGGVRSPFAPTNLQRRSTSGISRIMQIARFARAKIMKLRESNAPCIPVDLSHYSPRLYHFSLRSSPSLSFPPLSSLLSRRISCEGSFKGARYMCAGS